MWTVLVSFFFIFFIVPNAVGGIKMCVFYFSTVFINKLLLNCFLLGGFFKLADTMLRMFLPGSHLVNENINS